MKKYGRQGIRGLLLTAPVMLGCMFLYAVPFLMVFWYSFRSGMGGYSTFTGLENYRKSGIPACSGKYPEVFSHWAAAYSDSGLWDCTAFEISGTEICIYETCADFSLYHACHGDCAAGRCVFRSQ